MPIFDVSLADLRRRTSLKWRRYPPDVLPAWVAEMDCRPAPAVREALIAAVTDGDTGYPIGEAYQEAYAKFAADRWDWRFDPRDAVIVPDVMQGVARVAELLTPPGSAIVVNNPVYNCFYGYLPWADRRILEVPLTADHRLDLAALADAFAGRGGVKPTGYLLCNPHNPTGTLHTADELAAVAELAAAHDVVVISDEIHAPLADGGFVPYLAVPGTENAVTVTSASKAWNLAGAKAAIAIGGAQTADALRTLPDEVTHSASHLGIVSHVAALTGALDWLDELNAELAANRAQLAELIATELPGLVYTPGPATFLAWIDCSALGWDNPAARFVAAGRVALSDGGAFGSAADQFVRLNYATSPKILAEVVSRMAHAVASVG